jgi:hypothetical protein
MPGAWLTADEIIAHIDELIRVHGEAAMFGPNDGFAQLYSGPKKSVLNNIRGVSRRNHERAVEQAKVNKAIILDETPIGKLLDNFSGLNIYDYMKANPFVGASLKRREADRVMRHVSRPFIASLWGEVSTAVCAAGKDRVFYKDELPTITITIPDLIASLMKLTDITKINGIEVSKIRAAEKSGGYDAAFRLICLGELREAHKRALKSGDVDQYQDYLERREFYMVERNLTWKRMKKGPRPAFALSPKEREVRREVMLNEFIAVSLSFAKAISASDPTPVTGTIPRKSSGGPSVA